MKYHTREKRKRMRRRRIRRMIWRMAPYAAGILLVMMVWKLTSFAVRQLSGEEEIQQEEQLMDTEEDEMQETFQETEPPSSAKKDEILLVNKTHPLPEDYEPSLKRIGDYGADVAESIYDPLLQMLEDGKKEGLSFWIASSYRSPNRQRELLDEDIEALVRQGYSYSQAYEEVTKETMPVGCSEHATGLAVDIVAKDYQHLDEQQGRTEEVIWLQEHCSQYGFILRYPKDKEDITKVSYESWHFRYVGEKAAKEIMSQGLTLEEYLDSVE